MAKGMTRKNRKNNMNAGMENTGMGNNSMNQMGGKRKSKAKKGSRKLSPALREWNRKVMEIYREMKKKNPNTRLMDAMKEAKKRS
jgi:hypothetical protein